MSGLDTETTGRDFAHGSLPFYLTTCDLSLPPDERITFFEWPVDPLTRKPQVPKEDIATIQNWVDITANWGRPHFSPEIQERHKFVLHNGKFDIMALTKLGIKNWPWNMTHDTLVASHVLSSNTPHDLTSLGKEYLGESIEKLEETLYEEVKRARDYYRHKVRPKLKKEWKIAKDGMPELPSAGGEKVWVNDFWLPKCMATYLKYPDTHEWHTVLRDYSNADSEITARLWEVMKAELVKRDLWEIYLEMMKGPPVLHRMELRGMTYSNIRKTNLVSEYEKRSEDIALQCSRYAKEEYDYNLEMPKGSINKNLYEFATNVLKLPKVMTTATGRASYNGDVLDHYIATMEPGPVLDLVKGWADRNSLGTALGYLDSYDRYAVPKNPRGKYESLFDKDEDVTMVVYPSVNPTGTDTLRSTSSNPNAQQISKKKNFNLRYIFGPEEGREWVSTDAENIELRIPAYMSGEKTLIDVFDHPNKAPYFGSYHLVIFDILHPDLFKKHGAKCKELFDSTWYQWTKNGNFAILYGAQRAKADATYHVLGAYDKINRRLTKLRQYGEKQISIARKRGYVETVVDPTVNPRRGYPIKVALENGSVSPTRPLNYHVQSTACYWKRKAMVRVDAFYQYLNSGGKFRGKKWPDGYYLLMDIHDELLHDMPKGKTSSYNLPVVNKVKELMMQGSKDIGIPITVGVKYFPVSWDKPEKMGVA